MRTKIRIVPLQRPKLWTFDFFLALFLALVIHAMGFLFFRIDLKGFLNPTNYLSTVKVSSEQGSTIGDYQQLSPPEIPPFLEVKQARAPSLDLVSIALSMIPKTKNLDLAELALSSPFTPATSQFFLSGGNVFLKEPKVVHSKKIGKAKLEFKASPDTGSIFWLNWLETTGDSQCDHAIVETLKESKLIPSHSSLALAGIIEVEFET